MTSPVFACDRSAIPAAARAEHHALIHRVVSELATDTAGILRRRAIHSRGVGDRAVLMLAACLYRANLSVSSASLAARLTSESGAFRSADSDPADILADDPTAPRA